MKTYPRLCLLLSSFVLAYALYHLGAFDWLHALKGHGYISIFIGGLLFSFGFTTPIAIAIFIEMSPYINPFIAAPIAGIGALLSDFFIFDLIRVSLFQEEIARLRSSRLILRLYAMLHHETISERMRRFFLWSFAGLIIASPLPDEFGVTLVSSMSQMQPRLFATVCFCFNTTGILIIFLGAKAIA